WPRHAGNDSILPDHVLPSDEFDVDPLAKSDRRNFRVILAASSGDIVLSRSRRSAQGSRVGRSPLLLDRPEQSLSRARIPEHAWSEADRLMARPEDAAKIDRMRSAHLCWRNWHIGQLTRNEDRKSV